METIGFTLHVLGEVIVATMVLRVHHRVREEHRIDDKVFRAMKREYIVGIFGIILILTGFLLQLPAKL